MAIDPMDYGTKDILLDVVRAESDKFFAIVDKRENWTLQTRCEEWQVRDMVGHMIDVTEGYLGRWELARSGQVAPAPAGLLVMSEQLNEHAQSFRGLPREEAIARLKNDYHTMMTIFEGLTPEDWGGLIVSHPYMGPIPSLFFPSFQLMDYGVHTWDMNWGLGQRHARMAERSAGALVPYMFVLMSSTVDQDSARDVDAEFGIVVDGEWGGQWRVRVKDGQFTATSADNLDGVQATFHFAHPSDFVLTSFQRFPGGETSGDPKVIDQIRHLFFRI
jgi:uncharacterized protein (TIGR03083 family)